MNQERNRSSQNDGVSEPEVVDSLMARVPGRPWSPQQPDALSTVTPAEDPDAPGKGSGPEGSTRDRS